MPIARKDDGAVTTTIKPVAVSNELAPDVRSTLSTVSKISVEETPKTVAPKVEAEKKTEAKTDEPKYSDTVIARLSSGKRAEFKSFFAKYGITMNSGIEMSIEYVMEMVNNGNARISKAGVK